MVRKMLWLDPLGRRLKSRHQGHCTRNSDLDFYWVPLSELRNGLKVYPLELMPIILEDSEEIVHFVSRER